MAGLGVLLFDLSLSGGVIGGNVWSTLNGHYNTSPKLGISGRRKYSIFSIIRGLVSKRKKHIAKSSTEPLGIDPMNKLAQKLDPHSQHLVIAEITDETTRP